MKAPWFTSFVVIGAALSQMGSTGGGCGGHVLLDPGFDLWCGDQLCAWKVERGDAKRVATWHEGDSGVELVGMDSAIEQLSPVNSGDGTCIKFDLVANVEDTAEVYLNVDIQSDGTLEMHERLPTSNWKPLTFEIYVSGLYDGIRFELTKRGSGKAVLANIEANLDGSNCVGLTPLDPSPRKNGSRCAIGTDCASGLCIGGQGPLASHTHLGLVCAGCDPRNPSSCGVGQACSVGDAPVPVTAPPMQCEPKASRELGEMCIADADCASNICFTNGEIGTCSTCRSSADCTSGGTCAQSYAFGTYYAGPYLCGGGAHAAQRGWACANNDDCASSSCGGAVRKECGDGRPCSSAADCPFGNTGSNGLHNGACTTVGVQGGICD
jgi:hypothetical protein